MIASGGCQSCSALPIMQGLALQKHRRHALQPGLLLRRAWQWLLMACARHGCALVEGLQREGCLRTPNTGCERGSGHKHGAGVMSREWRLQGKLGSAQVELRAPGSRRRVRHESNHKSLPSAAGPAVWTLRTS